jgi:uracil-DNA glycosylase
MKPTEKLLGYYWAEELNDVLLSEEMKTTSRYISGRRNFASVLPEQQEVFSLFKRLQLKNIRIVFISEAPTSTKSAASGIGYASLDPFETYPENKALINHIEKNFKDGMWLTPDRDLKDLVANGIFFLNQDLTCEEDNRTAHKGLWESFTSSVLKLIAKEERPICFILWGQSNIEFFDKNTKGLDLSIHKVFKKEDIKEESTCLKEACDFVESYYKQKLIV